MKRLILLFAVAVSPLFSGAYGDAFIQASLPAHAAGMGSVAVTQLRGLSSVIANPSGLSQDSVLAAFAQYSSMFGLASQSSLGIHLPSVGDYHLAVSWYHLGVDDIALRPDITDSLSLVDRRNYLREHLGSDWETFNDRENAVYLTLARNYQRNIKVGWAYDQFTIGNPVGISVKMINKSILDERAYGVGIDFGTKFIIPGNQIFYFRHLGDFVLGLNLENVYTTGIYWTTRHVDQVWMTVRSGIALHQPLYVIRSELWIIYERKEIADAATERFGIDFRMADRVSLRLGKDYYEWNGGLGLRLTLFDRDILLDYAYQQHSLNATHRTTLTFNLRANQ